MENTDSDSNKVVRKICICNALDYFFDTCSRPHTAICTET